MKVTKKILLSTYILASGITNTVVYAESISHTPQIYVNIRSASGLNFNKQMTDYNKIGLAFSLQLSSQRFFWNSATPLRNSSKRVLSVGKAWSNSSIC